MRFRICNMLKNMFSLLCHVNGQVYSVVDFKVISKISTKFNYWGRVEFIFGIFCATCCNSSHQKTWRHCSVCVKNNPVRPGFIRPTFKRTTVKNFWRSTVVKYHKGRNKVIKNLNTKIPTDPYKMSILPVGIPYSLQKPINPYCRDFSLRVATLQVYENACKSAIAFVASHEWMVQFRTEKKVPTEEATVMGVTF